MSNNQPQGTTPVDEALARDVLTATVREHEQTIQWMAKVIQEQGEQLKKLSDLLEQDAPTQERDREAMRAVLAVHRGRVKRVTAERDNLLAVLRALVASAEDGTHTYQDHVEYEEWCRRLRESQDVLKIIDGLGQNT